MKVINCNFCKGPAQTKSGLDYVIGSLQGPEIVVKCWACRKATRVKITQWSRLPEASAEQIQKATGIDIRN